MPAPHRMFPRLQAAAAPSLLEAMHLVVVVALNDDAAVRDALFAFGDALVGSRWYTTIGAEYGVSAAARPAAHVTGPALTPGGAPLDEKGIIAYVKSAIGSSTPLQPDGHTMYMVYLPKGVDSAYDVGCSTPAANAYHDAFDSTGDAFGVVDRCNVGFATVLEGLTIDGAHEIGEAATDADAAHGWMVPRATGQPVWKQSPWLSYDTGPVENGDLCVGTRVVENGVTYQRMLSNAAIGAGGDPCVPALPIPYYSTSTENDWYSGAPGSTVDIPFTGWSTAPAGDWIVTQALEGKSAGTTGWVRSITSPRSTTVGGTSYHLLNNGEQAVLHVTVPAGAPSGSWATVILYSSRVDASGATPADEDYVHEWIVGVYVP